MILKDIWLDVKAVQERDPAARNALEVLLLYQGVHAMIWHRFAHWFYKHKMFFTARLISQVARFFTLIEIHPGAEMGHGILIDHGCGVVIGETCIIGDHVTLYQGVTLGATGKTTGNRHPILQNNTVIGAGAKIIGRITIGHDARIGAGSVIIRDVPPYTTMVPAPARPVRYRNHKLPVLTVERLNSRMEEELRYIRNTEERLERKMRCLERKRRSVPCREPERLRH